VSQVHWRVWRNERAPETPATAAAAQAEHIASAKRTAALGQGRSNPRHVQPFFCNIR
jgi:hypothetical protein